MLVISSKIFISVDNKQHERETKANFISKIMETLSEYIKLARKGRKLTTTQLAERAAIDRSTLYEIEKGSSSVSIGAYFNTLRVLGLQDDFLKLVGHYEYG